MSTENISLISLPHWESGKRKIRFLYLASDNSFRVTEQDKEEGELIPLFLGADLFSNTDIRAENHPRYHAKFSRRGLATKLVFPPGVYIYLYGLLAVSLEQWRLKDLAQGWWHRLDHRIQGLRVSSSGNGLWFYCVHGLFRVAFELYTKHEQLSVLESFQDLWKSRLNDEQLKAVYKLEGRLQAPPDQDTPGRCLASVSSRSSESQEVDPVTSRSADVSRSADHDYCSISEQVESRTSNLVAERLRSIRDKVSHMEARQEDAVLKLLDHAESLIDGDRDEEKLTEAVMALLHAHPRDFSVYSSPLLQTLAAWLGQQFHAANGGVSLQVEGFKRRHIERISDLPAAEELATELFPEAMRNLLVRWMGLGEEAAAWKRLSEYPIVLLILEFANHNLITGAAHVLYSSLICR